jgi:hypothetical protein
MNPPVEVVLLMIFESVVTEFSLSISESTGAASANESMRHLWKQFR